jgi:hypothetical protein
MKQAQLGLGRRHEREADSGTEEAGSRVVGHAASANAKALAAGAGGVRLDTARSWRAAPTVC